MPIFVNEVRTEIEPVTEAPPPEVPPLPMQANEQELLRTLALVDERNTRLTVD